MWRCCHGSCCLVRSIHGVRFCVMLLKIYLVGEGTCMSCCVVLSRIWLSGEKGTRSELACAAARECYTICLAVWCIGDTDCAAIFLQAWWGELAWLSGEKRTRSELACGAAKECDTICLLVWCIGDKDCAAVFRCVCLATWCWHDEEWSAVGLVVWCPGLGGWKTAARKCLLEKSNNGGTLSDSWSYNHQ